MGLELDVGWSSWVFETGELVWTSDAGGEGAADDGSERGVGRLTLVDNFGRGNRGMGNLFCTRAGPARTWVRHEGGMARGTYVVEAVRGHPFGRPTRRQQTAGHAVPTRLRGSRPLQWTASWVR